MKRFYEPSLDTLDVLSRPFLCSYSGGKDSTSLVTWIEWLRRADLIDAPSPALVMSDTGVEYPFLADTSKRMMDALSASGWNCEVVVPPLAKRLYVQIFGRGVYPISPQYQRGMRWCTRATKVDPMEKWGGRAERTMVSGVRFGESSSRDQKILKTGCSPGGECGVIGVENLRYAPIVQWTDCHVLDWLCGSVDSEVRHELKRDLYPITANLVRIYDPKKSGTGFGLAPQKVSMSRFGCIGCPAITPRSGQRNVRNFPDMKSQVGAIYGLWDRCWDKRNRLVKLKNGKWVSGPIKMESRQLLFAELLAIQNSGSLKLVTAEEEAFIRQCWVDKVYSRGWSAEDEKNVYRPLSEL